MAKSAKKAKKNGGSGASKGWFALIVLLVLGGAGYVFLKPSRVTVPDLIGKSRQEAETLLRSRNLQVEVHVEAPEEGSLKVVGIHKQTPEAGAEVPPGTVVTIFVSDQPVGIEIPDVLGQTRSEAEDALLRLGLTVNFTESTSQTIPVGHVISQDPKAGPSALQKGGQVTLIISGGKGEATVPDLTDLTLPQVEQKLKELGLEIVVREVAQPGFGPGQEARVVRQEPKAGSLLPVGSRVTVFLPIEPPAVTPPDQASGEGKHAPRLEGLTVKQARELARAEGVEIEFAESAEDSSVITFQDPPPGDPLPGGQATVLIRTATSAVVPGLAGMSEAQARAEVKKADLSVGTIRKSYGPVPGEVLGQRPSAGIEVVAGSRVDLVIADPALNPDAARNPDPVPTPALNNAPWVGE